MRQECLDPPANSIDLPDFPQTPAGQSSSSPTRSAQQSAQSTRALQPPVSQPQTLIASPHPPADRTSRAPARCENSPTPRTGSKREQSARKPLGTQSLNNLFLLRLIPAFHNHFKLRIRQLIRLPLPRRFLD